jgi:hypothetical protein
VRDTYPDATWVDLLRTDDFVRYPTRPALLRGELLDAPRSRVVVIDEAQKVPALMSAMATEAWERANGSKDLGIRLRKPRVLRIRLTHLEPASLRSVHDGRSECSR